ncbi:MAG: purine-nucleoside phosphorylase [Actinobacteria bacterium]|nr:purine-nucleoside phosphorylase [Actinomycetota bacterium]
MRPEADLVARTALALAPRLHQESVDVFLTLGSGLSSVADRIEDPVDIPMAALPNVAVSTVPGHTGTLRFGTIAGQRVLAQLGRVHLYEGHEPQDVTRMVSVAAWLGASTFVVTNAAGGLEPSWSPGDLMVLEDHLNLTGATPLIGVLRDEAPVFLDMAGAYDPELRAIAHRVADMQDVELRDGVYAGLVGPAYETPAEVRMLRTLGAQAVGMSTVLEVIAARAHGMRVLGFSSITNVHGEGVSTSHEEVIEVGGQAARRLAGIVLGVLEEI